MPSFCATGRDTNTMAQDVLKASPGFLMCLWVLQMCLRAKQCFPLSLPFYSVLLIVFFSLFNPLLVFFKVFYQFFSFISTFTDRNELFHTEVRQHELFIIYLQSKTAYGFLH